MTSLLLCSLCALSACGPLKVSRRSDAATQQDAGPTADAGVDAAVLDATAGDAAPVDSTVPDAALADAAVPTACSPYPCPAGATCYDETGLVHAPTPAYPVHRLTYTPPAGTYTKFRLEMDVYHGGWSTSGGHRHNLFWLARDARNFDMLGYANFEMPSTVHLVHGYGMPHGDKPKLRTNASLPALETYHVSYTYDPGGQTLNLTVTQGGNAVSSQTATPNITAVQFNGNVTIDMDMGFPEGLNPTEPATYGWEYRNICLQVIP